MSSELYVGGSSGESASLDFRERSGRAGERRGLLGPARGWSSICIVDCATSFLGFQTISQEWISTFFSSSITDADAR